MANINLFTMLDLNHEVFANPHANPKYLSFKYLMLLTLNDHLQQLRRKAG